MLHRASSSSSAAAARAAALLLPRASSALACALASLAAAAPTAPAAGPRSEGDVLPARPLLRPRKRPSQMVRPAEHLVSARRPATLRCARAHAPRADASVLPRACTRCGPRGSPRGKLSKINVCLGQGAGTGVTTQRPALNQGVDNPPRPLAARLAAAA